MGVFATDKNHISYIYSSDSDIGKKVLGYIESLEFDCRVIDIVKDPLPDTAWTEIAAMAGTSLEGLFSHGLDASNSVEDRADFDTDGWLKMIKKNPELLQKPIVIKGENAKQINARSGILAYFGVDSAGLNKTMHNEHPTTSSTTEGENFVPEEK